MQIVEGCVVQHKTKNNIRGEVLEIGNGRAFLKLENGVEDDYPLQELQNVAPTKGFPGRETGRVKR